MLSFRTQKDAVASSVIVISLAAIVVLALYLAFAPQPSAAGLAKAKRTAVEKLEKEIEEAKRSQEAVAKALVSHLRAGEPDKISPALLSEVTELAQATGLKVNSFRPQRTIELGELTQLPYVLTVEGSFTSVASLLRRLEEPKRKIATTLVQINSADGASDTVTATIGMSVYIRRKAAESKEIDGNA
jgi:Tfp pilus assembly protein PilO